MKMHRIKSTPNKWLENYSSQLQQNMNARLILLGYKIIINNTTFLIWYHVT